LNWGYWELFEVAPAYRDLIDLNHHT